MAGVVAGTAATGGLMTLLGSGATIGTASAAGGLGAATAGGLASAGAGTLAAGSAGITAAAGGAAGTAGSALTTGAGLTAAMGGAGTGTFATGMGGTLGATTTATPSVVGAGGSIGSSGTPALTPAQMLQQPVTPMTPGPTGTSFTPNLSNPGAGLQYQGVQAGNPGTSFAPHLNNPGAGINLNAPGQGINAISPATNTGINNIQSAGRVGQNLMSVPPSMPAAPELNYLQQLAKNPYYRSLAMGQLAKLARKKDRAGSVPVTYATARAEAERKRRNFMTGTAYQTQAKMIKDPTSQKNILRMGGPRAVTQSRLLADEAVKNRALNQLILGSTQLEMKEQQMADQYGIMADKTQLDLDLLADTQKRAQSARDEQALTASMAMGPYANSDGGGSNAMMQQMLMQQMLKQNP